MEFIINGEDRLYDMWNLWRQGKLSFEEMSKMVLLIDKIE